MDSQKRFGLSADERIRSRKDFEQIYTTGRVLYSSDRRIKAIFLISQSDEKPGVKIAPAVSKKAGIAVWRNRMKRLIKEAYRLNKEILTGTSVNNKVLIRIVFSPNLLNEKNFKWPNLKDLMPGVVEVMLKIKSVL